MQRMPEWFPYDFLGFTLPSGGSPWECTKSYRFTRVLLGDGESYRFSRGGSVWNRWFIMMKQDHKGVGHGGNREKHEFVDVVDGQCAGKDGATTNPTKEKNG